MMTSKKLFLLLISAFLFSACIDTSAPDFEEYDNTADLAFLEENAQRDDVTVTESGLQYRVIEEGDGILPTAESVVVFNFIGKFVDGEEFNNTFGSDEPVIAGMNFLPAGLREGLQLSPLGSRYEFVLPPDLAYGNNPPVGIPRGAVLIFEVLLIHSNNYDAQFLEENATREDITVTESGLQYRVIEEGTGERPGTSSSVNVEYTGSFIYENTFTTTRNTEDPATINLSGNFIDGFVEGILLMQEGARYEFFIPGNLAYGPQPPPNSPIYPDAALIFDIELISVDD